jgi:DNA uptake protein ComE-like DNA-binding protein
MLLALIIVLQLVFMYYPFGNNEPAFDIKSDKIIRFQKEIDSLKQIEIEKRKPKIYPFNPSFLSDYKASKLGMSLEEIDRLIAHRKAGKYINSAEEFQQVTKVNDSLLAQISPYFKFPDWVIAKNKRQQAKRKQNKTTTVEKSDNIGKPTDSPMEKQDLNTATAAQLQEIRGVGEKLAQRIVKYRKVLKGYYFNDQLYEVWYLKPEVAQRILARFTVKDKPKIEKININTASFKEVLHLPYIDYNLTKKIFNKRDELAEFQSLETLKKIDSFPSNKFDRISLYLKAE